MPNKKLLIGGAAAVLLSLAAYLLTMPKKDTPIPVSKEEFTQDLKGVDFGSLKGAEREQALQKLQESLKHVPVSMNAAESTRLWSDPDLMKAILSLKIEERAQLVGPSSERFRKAHGERLDRFFDLSEEEQKAEIDRLIDMFEQFDKMYKLMGGKHKDLITDRIKNTSPEQVKEMVVTTLRETDSATRAKLQEAARRGFRRWGERRKAAAKAKMAEAQTDGKPMRKDETSETEQIVVERPVVEELERLKVDDPVTIANLAKPGMPPRMIVARGGRQVGALPISKWMKYADYLAEKRLIWAKVLELDPARSYLVIETRVE